MEEKEEEEKMKPIVVVRTLEFDAGHRLYNHESKCANMHGHRYKVELHAMSTELDHVGRVIDFSIIKDWLGGWIDKHWDHGFIYCAKDKACVEFFGAAQGHGESFGRGKYYVMDVNPTAENMARLLLNVSVPLFSRSGVAIVKIVLWETPNCRAEVEW